jgi:hypothetical protein
MGEEEEVVVVTCDGCALRVDVRATYWLGWQRQVAIAVDDAYVVLAGTGSRVIMGAAGCIITTSGASMSRDRELVLH